MRGTLIFLKIKERRKIMRCGAYVRVSTDDQRDNGYSIDSQPRMIKEYNEYFYILLFAFNFTLSIDSFVLSILLLNPRPPFHL